MEVKGLDSLKRFSLKTSVTPKELEAAQALMIRRAAQRLAPKVYTARAVAQPPSTDGNVEPWELTKDSLEIDRGNEKIGVVKMAYDATHLYLAYLVRDGSPLKNAGQNEQLMFITGDCVDLMLRTDPTTKDEQPVRGDLRLLFTVKDGKPLAVIYQPVAPGAPASHAAELSSPWRRVHFDRIQAVELPLTLKPVPGGYAVTTAVPLKLLGVDSLKGKVLRGDFGVLLSDAGGQECTSRNYWCNKFTNNANDIPDEAMLTPSLWGELRFE